LRRSIALSGEVMGLIREGALGSAAIMALWASESWEVDFP
jgi:hypothetical protein